MRFCENPACRCHVEIPNPPLTNTLRYVEANGKEVETRQHWLMAENGRKLALCSVCVNVGALINQLNDPTIV